MSDDSELDNQGHPAPLFCQDLLDISYLLPLLPWCGKEGGDSMALGFDICLSSTLFFCKISNLELYIHFFSWYFYPTKCISSREFNTSTWSMTTITHVCSLILYKFLNYVLISSTFSLNAYFHLMSKKMDSSTFIWGGSLLTDLMQLCIYFFLLYSSNCLHSVSLCEGKVT